VTDPANPKSAGCASEDGYVHDAQCLTYIGPDAAYNGSDICYSFNENSFTIYNITEPSTPEIISSTGYYGVSYSHQGWVIDEFDQRYVLLDDELDEMNSTWVPSAYERTRG
jgi:choice-of-anchor B domain-containing protein